jgi:outer membrane lipoprotein SlyB
MIPIKRIAIPLLLIILLGSIFIGCSGGSLTTREKGAGIGALGGAAAGGLIGAAVGHPGAGAAIGGALGLGTGALIGDQFQGQEIKQRQQDEQIRQNQAEIERQRQELQRIKRQNEY